jgi:hypothetical protein
MATDLPTAEPPPRIAKSAVESWSAAIVAESAKAVGVTPKVDFTLYALKPSPPPLSPWQMAQ